MRIMLEPAVGLLLKALLVGMTSSVFPVLIVFSVLLSTGYLGGNFGIVTAVVATMSTSAVSMSYTALDPLFATTHEILQHTNRSEHELKAARKLCRLGDRAANSVKGMSFHIPYCYLILIIDRYYYRSLTRVISCNIYYYYYYDRILHGLCFFGFILPVHCISECHWCEFS